MPLPESIRKQILGSKSRDELRDMLRDLFESKGFGSVSRTNVSSERGIDLVFSVTVPEIGTEWCGAVAVAGGIGGGAPEANNPDDISRLAKEALTSSHIHPLLPEKYFELDRLFVITNGLFTESAKARIRGHVSQELHKNVECWGVDRLVREIDSHRPELYSLQYPYVLRCIENAVQKFTQSKELVPVAQRSDVELADVFVNPVLLKLNPGTQQGASLTFEQAIERNLRGERVQVRSAYEQLERPGARLVVIGEPGSGKTMLVKSILERLALSYARVLASVRKEQDINVVTKDTIVPVVISATDISMGAEGNIELDAIVRQQLVTTAGQDAQAVRDLIEKGEIRLLLILDGLDEIPAERGRAEIARTVSDWAERNPAASVLVTSRVAEFSQMASWFPQSFEVLNILPLEWKQIREVVSKLAAVLKFDKSEMLGVIQRELSSLLGRLPATPMVFTLLAMTLSAAHYKEIPASLTILYREFMDLLLGKWDTTRGMISVFESRIKEGFLAQLAYEMHVEGRLEIGADEIFRKAEKFFSEQGLDKGENGSRHAAFVKDIVTRSSILGARHSAYYFRHQSYQEYFAAKYIDTMRLPEDPLIEHALDDWWYNIVFFYCGFRERINEDFLDKLNNLKVSGAGGLMPRALSYGHFTQAAFMSLLSVKEKAVRYGIDDIVAFRESLLEIVRKAPENTLGHITPALILRMSILLARQGYSSSVLTPALIAHFDSLEGDKTTSGDYKRFLTAAALSELGYHEKLKDALRLSTTTQIKSFVSNRIEAMSGGAKPTLELEKRAKHMLKRTERALQKDMDTRIFDARRIRKKKVLPK